MATDRERISNVKIITKVTYEKIDGDLWQRTRVKVKDIADVIQIISDDNINVGRKQAFKKELVAQREQLQDTLDRNSEGLIGQIEFLEEQITDIEAL